MIGTPVENMLRSMCLPAEPDVEAGLLLPELPCWCFVQSLARTEGIANPGLIAGNTISHQDLATLVALTAGCTNLYDVLKRFCLLAPLFSNNNLYVLEEEEHLVWFTQKGARLVADDIEVQLFWIHHQSPLFQVVLRDYPIVVINSPI
jgi:hypothetical protein